MDVPQTDIVQELELLGDPALVGEKLQRVGYRKIQHVGNAAALVANLERFPIIAPALTHFAWHVYIRQEVHLDLDETVTLAGFAPTSLDVERESPRAIATHLCLRK